LRLNALSCKFKRKFLKSPARFLVMDEIRLLLGKPQIKNHKEFIHAVRNFQARTGLIIQAIDADKMANERHLTFAAEKALLAFAEKRNIAKDIGVEVLRYASGERQIERALSMGASATTKRIALIMIKPEKHIQPWPDLSELAKLLEVDDKGCSFNAAALKETFNISREEISAASEAQIPELVLERVALVDTMR
jgi:KEOPS complex subunit Cgi121